ncbi:DddA-like double-stranded DNA deaminase toxin [Lentzea sp. E54]|uniref:DddA-like double-stranded DNA deaminase toxin n=1 Tax=Lentzea xerophila TaxID=3435883 RepID=UPI003DA3E5F9
MATLEEVAAVLRNAADSAAKAVAPLIRAEELAEDAIDLIRSAGQGSSALEAEIEQAIGQFAQVKPEVAELLGLLDAAQKGIAGIVSALMGAGGAVPKASPAGASALPAASQTAETKPEPSWAEQQRPNLPRYITSGIYVDQDGHSDIVQSGSEANGEHERINRFLIEEDLVFVPDGALATVSMHVEMKLAWRMRQGGARRVEVVINRDVCGGPMGCEELLEDVLLPGQELVVHDPVGSRVFHGRDAE